MCWVVRSARQASPHSSRFPKPHPPCFVTSPRLRTDGNLSLNTAGYVEFVAISDDLSRTQNQSDNTGLKNEEKQRILGIVPARNIVLSGEAPPLTKAQKFRLFTQGSIDPFAFFVAGVVAGIEQSKDSYPGWGQDAAGFGQRYGAVYADNVDSRLWGAAVLPSLFHQDPRYFRKGQGPKRHRLLYAIASVGRCKGDNGHWQFAYSSISGRFIAGGVANAYYPQSSRGTALLLNRGLVVTAEGAIGYIVSEFYPDVVAHFHHDPHRQM